MQEHYMYRMVEIIIQYETFMDTVSALNHIHRVLLLNLLSKNSLDMLP